MDPRTLDGLSPAELRSLDFEIQARIRRDRARSENRSPSQPYPLQRAQTQIEPYQFQSIIQNGNLRGIPPRWQEDLGTNFQTQVQLNSRDISSVLSSLDSDISMHRNIAAVGRSRDLVSAQPYGATTTLQPLTNGSALTSSFFEVGDLALENHPLPTSSSVGWLGVPQLPLIWGTPDASSNTYGPYPGGNDLTGQYGATTASMTAMSQSPGSILYIPQEYQSEAAYWRSLIGKLPGPNDFEPTTNWTNLMASGALVDRNMRSPQPNAPGYILQVDQTDDFNGNGRPTTFGLAVPGADTIEAQMAPKSPEPRGITQTKRKRHDETTNLSTTKTASKKKKLVRGFPNKTQKENTNRVKENGGACARCKKQKNKCIFNPDDPEGVCFTCAKLGTPLDRQRLCFRGNITDVVLFRNNVDHDYGRPDFSIHFRIGKGILKPIKDFGVEGKDVELTRGLGLTLRLHVLKAKTLDPEDIPPSQRFIYDCPWALADFPKAVNDYTKFLWGSTWEEVTNKIRPTEAPLAFEIFQKAWELANRGEGPSLLLQKVLMVWSGSRQIEGGWHFHGSEALGQQSNNEGKVPPTAAPILDSQISSVIVRHHLQSFRAWALAEIQKLGTQRREIRSERMFELFLTFFILLHNCECIMKHQRNWAIHNNSPFRYTPNMMELVKGVLHTVKTVLYLWRSDLRGQFPFDPEWNPDSPGHVKIVKFTPEEIEFFREAGKKIEGKEEYFNQLSQNWENYDRDYCFTGQLFVRDGRPFDQTWLEMPDLPENPPALMYGPASPTHPTHQLPIPLTIHI